MNQNKLLLDHAISRSFTELKDSVRNAEKNLNESLLQMDVNYRLGTFLHWVLDYNEWITKNYNNTFNNEEQHFFSGLRYANNKLKHAPDIIKMYDRTGGFSFPISFPMRIEEITFRWVKLGYEEESDKYENQYKNYVKYIEGNNVLKISEEAIEVLSKYSSR